MMVYVVNLGIEASMASEYPAWLCAHANDMLALPGFLAAEIFERLEPLPEPGRVRLSVHYRLHDRAAFDACARPACVLSAIACAPAATFCKRRNENFLRRARALCTASKRRDDGAPEIRPAPCAGAAVDFQVADAWPEFLCG